MQIGFVGLGKMGGNMVHRIHRDSDHQVVAFDLNEEHVREAEGHGAKRRRVARGARRRSSTRRGMVWIMVPAGDADPATIDALADAARGGRHDRRRRQHEAGTTTSRAPPR